MSVVIELQDTRGIDSQSTSNRPLDLGQDQQIESVAQHALPPVDRGRQAWLFLAAVTTIETLIWGLPFSVGILHAYWINTLFVGAGASTVTLAATLQTGLLYMSCAAFGPLFAAFPRWQKAIQFAGLMAASISMISSAFASKPWHLVVTIGFLYPLSGACYLPCATLLFEWFHARRGLASGIMYAGTGVGGTIFPFIMSALLNKVGYKAAMISLGIGIGILGSVALIPIRRRIPLSRYDHMQSGRRRRTLNWQLLKSTTMFIGVMTILLTSLGNFVPSLWLPSYANDLNLSKPNGTALIALLNAASIPGNALIGLLSDCLSLRAVILISCIGSSLSCAFLWGFGTNTAMLVAFVIIFGLLGLSFSALWSKIIGTIASKLVDDPIAPTLIFSIFAFTRGIGNITSGPISESLLKYSSFRGASGAYGFNNYGILLIYTAITILGGGVMGVMFKERRT
nr:monocarboxylic acid transporter [Cryptococcus depauperatus CBS 7841]